MSHNASLAGALTGVRVLDLSRLLPGPFATLVLADLGATVDKIEDPAQGDYLRHMPPQIGGCNVAYGMLNRGKRSAVLDLKKPEGQAALRAMLPSYDVLFEQFRPGVLARLSLDPAELRKLHPGLIVCSLSGYGQTGPYLRRAGHDLNYLARSGVLGAQGPRDAAPQVPGFQLADISGGMWSVIAILAALRQRAASGEGAWLDIAMSEGTLPFMLTSLGPALAGRSGQRGDEQLTGGIAPYDVYQAKDGQLMTFAALEPKFWAAFCAAESRTISISDLMPGDHQAELKAWVAKVFSSRTADEWEAFSTSADVPIEPVLSPAQVAEDPHIVAREMLGSIRMPDGTDLPQLRTPVTASQVMTSASPPPTQGQHTRSILEGAGLPASQIDALFASGVAR